MRGVKIKRKTVSSLSHNLLNFLSIALGILTALIILSFSKIRGFTGYGVLGNIYGSQASLIIVLLLSMIILLYIKIMKN
jgi:hypothetical protein